MAWLIAAAMEAEGRVEFELPDFTAVGHLAVTLPTSWLGRSECPTLSEPRRDHLRPSGERDAPLRLQAG